MYNSHAKKIYHWGDFRVPNVRCDFDGGSGEFCVTEKYAENEWANYLHAWSSYITSQSYVRNDLASKPFRYIFTMTSDITLYPTRLLRGSLTIMRISFGTG